MSDLVEADVVILGAGLAGLSAASILGDRALVLEREHRPGGLGRTECFDGFWFDRVVHLLHFRDPETQRRIANLLGSTLAPCPPTAWVETPLGTTRFPFQLHLAGLDVRSRLRCVRDFAATVFSSKRDAPENYGDFLLTSFGRAMCEIFFWPYNRKVWKRPLNGLAPSGFLWNIAAPRLPELLRGAFAPSRTADAYNSNGWYPRPPADSPIRGTEVLCRALADRSHDVRLDHCVERLNLDTRELLVRHRGRLLRFRYREACLATIPLPYVLRVCAQTPPQLRRNAEALTHNRVLSVALSIRGPRPQGRGHWRYYVDESVIFTRLIHLHEFDPDCAPANGWPLLAEITQPAEEPVPEARGLLAVVRRDLERVGALPRGSVIVGERIFVVDPAYVVFTLRNRAVIEDARRFLINQRVTPLGRYGRWEYSSMAQVMREGFAWGEVTLARLSGRGRTSVRRSAA